MGKYDDLATDAAGLLRRLTTELTPHRSDVRFAELARDLNTALARVSTLVPAHERLFLDRTRVSNEFRAAIDRYTSGEEPLVAGALLKECLEISVLPYVRSAAYEENIATKQPVEIFEKLEGLQIEKWKLLERIGIGGNSVVHKVRQQVGGYIACAKLIPLLPLRSEEQQERFDREIMVPAKIGHDALVPVIDAGVIDTPVKARYIIMELVNGVHINVWARKRHRAEILSMFGRALEPLALCHDHGLVHRDLKPSNVMVSNDGSPRILDFGHAAVNGRDTHTKTGAILGTLSYMSPEQMKNPRSANQQSDLWSLGVMLYELCSGLKVFPQESDAEIIAAVLAGRFAPPEAHLPTGLARVVRTCLQTDPTLRFAGIPALRKALAEGEPLTPRSSTFGATPEAMPLPRQEEVSVSTVNVVYEPPDAVVPLAEPVVSPYTLQFDSCAYCGSVGMWSGNRCARCGQNRGTD